MKEGVEQKKHYELIQSLPDPPAGEPLDEGQPEAKKTKIGSDVGDGWVEVSKPEEDVDLTISGVESIEELTPKTAEEQVEMEERKEDQHTALMTAEAGGDPPRNGLLGDW